MNTGSFTFKDWYTPTSSSLAYTGTGTGTNYNVRGFNMIGNPYPCPIDWLTSYSGSGAIVRTNVAPTMWVFNPITSQYDTYLATSSSTGTATGSASRYIASGQGFFVQATNTSPALTISEYAKVVLNAGTGVGTGAVPTGAQLTGTNLLMTKAPIHDVTPQSLRLKLIADSINYDDIVIGFNSQASPDYNVNEDARYIAGVSALEGLCSFSADSIKLSINYLPLPKLTPQVIRLNVEGRQEGAYTLQRAELNAIPKIYDIWLMDKYKKDSLDIKNNTNYVFNIDFSDTASYGANRFQLVIRQDQALAIHLLNFTGVKAPDGAQVTWVTENEENYTNFTVERSIDGGVTFQVLGGVPSSALGTYTFLDKNPPVAADTYRLKIEDLNGTISYSNVVTLMYANANNLAKNNISIYPNPAKTTLNLTITPAFSGNAVVLQSINPGSNLIASAAGNMYSIKIVNNLGSVIQTATTTQQDWKTDVSALMPGTYILQVINNKDNSEVGAGTFIKL